MKSDALEADGIMGCFSKFGFSGAFSNPNLVNRRNRTSDFLAQAPEVRVEEVCGGIALSGIDRGERASVD
jgi:hypothetical protein